MPFVKRDGQNKIIGIYANKQPGITEYLADDDAEVLAFNNPIITFISFDDFEARFTTDEWNDATDFVYEVDVVTGKPKRRALVQGLARAQARNSVDLLDAKTDTFLSVLVNGGVITGARKTVILTP